MPHEADPVLRNAQREGLIIGLAWLVSTIYCCAYCYFYGYRREGHLLGIEDIHPEFGMPSWVFRGIVIPWFVCGVFTVWFAGFFMSDDDLGADHASELDTDIREGGLHE